MISLPDNAIQRVFELLYPQQIAGTFGAAPVCRAWRDAAPAGDPRDLLIVLDELCDEQQLERVASWLRAQPHTLRRLQLQLGCWSSNADIEGFNREPERRVAALCSALEQGLCTVPPAAARQHMQPQQLTSLSLGDCDTWLLDNGSTLLLVAPLLAQLKQLQHLEAGMCVVECTEEPQQGLFCTSDWQPLQQVPDISAAAALTSFQLNMRGRGSINNMDERLSQLLPATLQQLHLAFLGAERPAVGHLMHLTNLRVLVLDRLPMADWEALLAMPALQQLALGWGDFDNALGSGLAPLLVQGTTDSSDLLRSHITDLTHLSLLSVDIEYSFDAAVLLQLPALTELQLHSDDHYEVDFAALIACVKSCAAVQQLRVLEIWLEDGFSKSPAAADVASALAALTQLTSMRLSLRDRDELAPWAAALRALSGLQHLYCPAPLLAVPDEWLAELTALKQLVIADVDDARSGVPLPQLSSVPPSL